ncbi:hypothetical protein B0H17DRAFT_1133229 [Mycena rosella]|uniref:Uncharacterized protein n=1 Tax=Mycena rosella TaxID=1033263 RepID=A0AAD7DIK5_MYCRO|nr:hypothetical protein B0H17DRAFT_1133229 [Mycena rosella]
MCALGGDSGARGSCTASLVGTHEMSLAQFSSQYLVARPFSSRSTYLDGSRCSLSSESHAWIPRRVQLSAITPATYSGDALVRFTADTPRDIRRVEMRIAGGGGQGVWARYGKDGGRGPSQRKRSLTWRLGCMCMRLPVDATARTARAGDAGVWRARTSVAALRRDADSRTPRRRVRKPSSALDIDVLIFSGQPLGYSLYPRPYSRESRSPPRAIPYPRSSAQATPARAS